MRGRARAGLCRGAGLMVHTLLAGGSDGSGSLSKLFSSLLQTSQKRWISVSTKNIFRKGKR